MAVCPNCGQENKDEARFCVRCGASLGAPAQVAMGTPPAGTPQVEPPAQPYATAAPPTAPPPTAAPPQPSYQQPAYQQAAQPPYQQPPYQQPQQPPYQQPAAYPQPQPPRAASPYAYGQPGYQPGAAYTPSAATYARAAGGRKPIFWIGAAIVALAGILVLVSSFMPWISGYGDSSGWSMLEYAEGGEYFYQDVGSPFFTGLSTLIAGILILIAGGLMLALRNKGISALAIIFSFIALGLAVTNVVGVVRLESSPGVGLYILIIFSLLGLAGGIMGASG